MTKFTREQRRARMKTFENMNDDVIDAYLEEEEKEKMQIRNKIIQTDKTTRLKITQTNTRYFITVEKYSKLMNTYRLSRCFYIYSDEMLEILQFIKEKE